MPEKGDGKTGGKGRVVPLGRRAARLKVVDSDQVALSPRRGAARVKAIGPETPDGEAVAILHLPDRPPQAAQAPQPAPPARRHRHVRLHWTGPRTSDRSSVGSRYRLVTLVGEGGTGVVYKAHDSLLLDMPVALKILNADLTHDPVAIETLKREARIAMQLSHPHIVRLHNLERTTDRFFLIMEYCEGQSLRAVLDRYGTLPPATVRQVVEVAADALTYAHRRNVLHNDLKPDNLLLSSDGVLKLIDFGVACLAHAQLDDDHVVGTPAYMSPEQKCGETLDVRTDVYALAIIASELLTGGLPYPVDASLRDVLETAPAGLPGTPEFLRPVLEKAIAVERDDRWESIAAFADAFAEACP